MFEKIKNALIKQESKKLEQKKRYSVYLPISKVIYIKSDFDIYLLKELNKYVSDFYFDNYTYEIDIVEKNRTKHLSLSKKKDVINIINDLKNRRS